MKKVALGVYLFLASLTVQASLITYTDKTTFTNSTSPILITTPSSGTSGTVVGPLTFTNGPSASVVFGDFTSSLSGELALSGDENFNVDIAGGAFSFGFDVNDPFSTSQYDGCNVNPCRDSEFSFSIFDGSTLLHSFNFDPLYSDSELTFVGIYSDNIFNRVEIREIVGSNDNEFFGNFLVGTTKVPEPSTLAIFALGMIGLASRRLKKQS
jgi:hypothetical protein